MRLIGYEFCKLFHKKVLLLIWLTAMFVLLFTFYGQCRESDIYDKELYAQLSEQYSAMDFDTALSKLEQESGALSQLQLYAGLQAQGFDEEILQTIIESQAASLGMTFGEIQEEYQSYIDDAELLSATVRVLWYLQQQYQYRKDYETFLSEMPARAENLTSISIFTKPYSFSYRHILKSVEDYGQLDGISIVADYNQGVLALTGDRYTILFLLVLMMFVAGVLYPEEVDSRMITLLTSNKKGRLPLALAKWITLTLFAVLTALIVSLGKIIIAGRVLGFGDLSRPIQSVSYFRNCCHWLTVGGFLGRTVLFWMLVMVFASGLLSLVFWLFRDVRFSGGIYGGYLLISYLAYRFIDDASIWNIWKFINPFSFADVSGRFSSYQNLNFFGYPISVFVSGGVAFVIVLGIILAGYFMAFARCYQIKLPAILRHRKTRIKGSIRLWQHEMFRLWIGNYGIVVLAVLMVLNYRNTEKSELLLDEDEYNYYAYSQQIRGEITPETDLWIAEETEKFNTIPQRSSELVNLYKQGEIDEYTYLKESHALEQFSKQQKAFSEISAQYWELKEVQGRGIPVHFINAIATDAIFGNMSRYVWSGMLLLLVCVFSLCGMFSNDYQTNMIFLVHTTRKGRSSVFLAKYGMMLLFYSLGFLCLALSLWYNWVVTYQMYDWGAPLQSISQFTRVKGNISIIGFIVLWFIQMYLSGCSFVILQAMLSLVCRKNSTTLIVSAICISLDFLISGFSFRGLSMLTLSSGFGLPMLLKSGGAVRLIWMELVKILLVIIGLLLYHRKRYINEL